MSHAYSPETKLQVVLQKSIPLSTPPQKRGVGGTRALAHSISYIISYIIYHISYIIYHISYIIYHISYIIYHISYIISSYSLACLASKEIAQISKSVAPLSGYPATPPVRHIHSSDCLREPARRCPET